MEFDANTVIGAVAGVAATSVLGGLGFSLKRWITGERSKEQVAELSVLANVASQMRQTGVSVEEVDALKRYLRQGERSEQLITAAEGNLSDEPETYKTQLEINEAARREFEKHDTRMEAVLSEIQQYLNSEERAELDAAQQKWLEFRQLHADFVSKLFEGGSMRPLWYITTIDIATRDRLDELEAYLEVRRVP